VEGERFRHTVFVHSWNSRVRTFRLWTFVSEKSRWLQLFSLDQEYKQQRAEEHIHCRTHGTS
jgi:hypothetical protein